MSTAKQPSPVVIRMPESLKRAVQKKARSDERSMAQAIRHALRLYVSGEYDQ